MAKPRSIACSNSCSNTLNRLFINSCCSKSLLFEKQKYFRIVQFTSSTPSAAQSTRKALFVTAIIVDVEYPNGDMNCTVRAAVDGDDIRFLSTKGACIDYPSCNDGWEKLIFVHVAPWSRDVTSFDLPHIAGVSKVLPSWVDQAARHMLRIRAVVPVHPIV